MPSPTYSLIKSTTLASNAASFDFTNIPQTYYDLRVHYSLRVTGASMADMPLTMNNNTGAVWRGLIMYPDSNTNTRGYGVGNGNQNPDYVGALWAAGGNIAGGSTCPTGVYTNGQMLIPGYRNTTNLYRRSIMSDTFTLTTGTGNFFTITGHQTSDASAVTRLTFNLNAGYGLLAAGSTVSLYGCTNS
jgi:hypothetical protein